MAGASEDPRFEFTAELWRYQGEAPWHFVTLPHAVSDAIDEAVGQRRGFGSVPVAVTVGGTSWHTSLFPDKAAGSFVLPVKADVRRREGIEAGSLVAFLLRLRGHRDPVDQ